MQACEHIVLHLTLISGVGPATIKIILEKVVDLAQIYNFSVVDFAAIGIGYDRAIKIVIGLRDRCLLDAELELITKYRINWCVLGSPEYSRLLSYIEQPPAVIYYQGTNLFSFDKTIAFVGARNCDAYARVVVEKIVPPLVKNDWVIVSGGALGVDSLVHDTTVRSNGKTIVVLGSGLLNWYPVGNNSLFNRVIQSGGMIVSCFSLHSKPIAANFPARNRIIAGLSQGTIVVQAAKKSGALITADFAVEQGRQVFAVPGSIEHGLHEGCHNLIQQGAKLVTSIDDIEIEFSGLSESMQESEKDSVQMQLPIESQSREEIILLEVLLVSRSVEDLLSRVDMPLEDLMQKLFELSLQGKISQDIMGLWKRI